MKSIWKWILGSLAVLAGLALLAAAAWTWQRHTVLVLESRAPFERAWDGPRMQLPDGEWPGPMGRGFDRFHGPMTGGRAFIHRTPFGGWFFPSFGLLRLLPLALVIGAVVLAYQMGKRAGLNSVTAAAPPPQPAPAARKAPRKKAG